MYVWVHVWVAPQRFPRISWCAVKRDREGKTFLVILEIHKAISSFRTANHFTGRQSMTLKGEAFNANSGYVKHSLKSQHKSIIA